MSASYSETQFEDHAVVQHDGSPSGAGNMHTKPAPGSHDASIGAPVMHGSWHIVIPEPVLDVDVQPVKQSFGHESHVSDASQVPSPQTAPQVQSAGHV